jgi:hypothetical protein
LQMPVNWFLIVFFLFTVWCLAWVRLGDIMQNDHWLNDFVTADDDQIYQPPPFHSPCTRTRRGMPKKCINANRS